MDSAVEKITEELYRCINYMRSTVDGLLACNSSNVWNVFGGLSRTKKAVYDILINELRLSTNKTKHDIIMIMTVELVKMYPCDGDIDSEIQQSEEALMTWIEHHLLAHSLFDCVRCAYLQQGKDTDLLQLYKEFSFMKNEILLNEFLRCLEALHQSSQHHISSVNPLHMTKAAFMSDITLWVSEKLMQEYKIEHRPPDEIYCDSSPKSRTFSSCTDKPCSLCNGSFVRRVSQGSLCECTCSEKIRARAVSLQPFNESVLLKSALSVALQNNHDTDSQWYEDDITMKSDFNDSRRLSFMREISRSESSLYHDSCHISTEMKENKSDNDALDYGNEDMSPTLTDEAGDEFCLKNITLQRSSATVERKKGHQRSKSDQVHVATLHSTDSKEIIPTVSSSSLPKELLKPQSHTYYYQNGDGVLFPKPYKGQSLISYLDSWSYDTGAQLDKENAHFSICEALITAIEQMRCQKMDSETESDDDSDEEIKLLKEKLTERRWFRKMEKQKKEALAFSDQSDTGKSSSFKTSSTFSSSIGSSNTDETQTLDTNHQDFDGNISDSWENLSFASKLKSPSGSFRKVDGDRGEFGKIEDLRDDYSAEAVAKCLLKKFDGHSIPAASELKWIVTEEDVPQELLPLPTAWPVNPDSHLQDDFSMLEGLRNMSLPFQSLLRGNLEWAPPRPQIIFSSHPFVKRKVMLQRQHFRCAGCGLKVTPSLSKRFRYCEYVGKYFCTSCHQNKLTYIPSKILSKWDFKKYPVSDFAKELLKKIYRDPLFNVQDISPNLYKNVRMLAMTKKLRLQMHQMKNFINTCRHAINCQKEMEKLAIHLIEDPHSYSIDDFLQVKTGELQTSLKSIVSNCIKHIKVDCPLCSAKGFFCEFCRDMDDILYPFDLHKVFICDDCKTCYHRTCFVQGKCAKCERLRARKKMIQEQLPDLLDSPNAPEPVS